ncbi:leucyl/phenylalanyl-tRNA--protein transferase [Ottowia sp.]|nr:leucyl/phenylalanyl-tRNA--protein transferase [Ottowia sp.]HOB65910.1 leucyl/phenylalanyl-tRNA--protein transferase [Ottowia sp.]HQD47747.1 leucyl/phenylalanyl-tRNA--protein transferase [Ottowia sp.]
MTGRRSLPVLRPGDPFPPLAQAWPGQSPAPGLVAAGGALDVPTLRAAYSSTIFPWFSEGEPILWWSPDPRMVLQVAQYRVRRSLRKALQRFRDDPACEVRVDSAFTDVIEACAGAARPGQSGTWIGPDMRAAYVALHRAGHAHSVETWVQGRLVAGLYCVTIGRAVFGESMFTHVADGSKIALSALVALCRAQGLPLIDCQQNTRHLAFMGAAEMPRAEFARCVATLAAQPTPAWHFDPVYWSEVLPTRSHPNQ